MHALRHTGLLALLASTAVAGTAREVSTLRPIPKSKGVQARADDSAVAPSTSVGLDYGIDTDPLVHVELDMQKPAVLLEDVASIDTVICSEDSISVNFTETAGFEAAVSSWANKGDLVFFTNHLGDCDVETERGVFVVNSISGDVKTLTIVAHAEKKDVASTASNTAITFEGVPLATQKRRVKRVLNERGITVNENGVNIAGTVGLPANTELYSFPPYLTVEADTAEITASVTFSGYLDYDILAAKLTQLYVDVDSSLDAEVGVTIAVTAEYRDTFSYTPGQLSYMIVDVPGIVSLGPELLFSIGLDVDVDAGVTVVGTAGAGLKNGRVHLDFLDTAKTTVTPWTPTYNGKLDLSEAAHAKVDTWVDVTFQLALEVLGGVLDLSAGLTARPRFNNEFLFTASQIIDKDGTVTQASDLTCSQGLAVKSDFTFSLIAFVSSLWSRTIYSVAIPVGDECYTWL